MDAFKQQLQKLQEQLSSLTATQRMLVFSLVAVMGLTLVLWSRYAGAPEMVSLLPQAVREADLARITDALNLRGVQYTTQGGSIMIRVDEKSRALAAVASDNALPSDSSKLVDDMLDRTTPFDSMDRANKMWKILMARQIEASVRHMDGVASARVTVENNIQQRIGSTIPATAGVHVSMKNDQKPSRKFVEGIAGLVLGSIAGIKRADIHIVIGETHYQLGDTPGFGGGDFLEARNEWEKNFADKVVRGLRDIPGLYVEVSARVNAASKETRLQSVDDVKSKETEITSEATETAQNEAGLPADPGVGANTSGTLAIGGGATAAAGPTNTSTKDRSVTKMENFPSRRDEHTVEHAGDAKATAASVSFPRSWVISQIPGTSADKEPDPLAVEAAIADQTQRITAFVRTTLNLDENAPVTVRAYVDRIADSDLAAAAAAESGGAASKLLSGPIGKYAKEIGIGVLAAASLFMVLMIVRRGAPAPLAVATIGRSTRLIDGEGDIDGNDPIIGVAAAGNLTLDAMELGEDDARNQQMVDQVNTLVKENPDAAASLVKRWLSRS